REQRLYAEVIRSVFLINGLVDDLVSAHAPALADEDGVDGGDRHAAVLVGLGEKRAARGRLRMHQARPREVAPLFGARPAIEISNERNWIARLFLFELLCEELRAFH